MLVRLLLLAASVVAIPDPNDPLLLEYRWLVVMIVMMEIIVMMIESNHDPLLLEYRWVVIC